MLENAQLRAAIAVSLGAIAGALCRYYLGQIINQVFDGRFPWGTFSVNVSGCFLMGLLTTLAAQRWMNPELRLLMTTGFLGSYTTFSTYELETATLVDQPGQFSDLAYWLGSPVLGFISLFAGIQTARFLAKSQPRDRS